MTINKQIVKVQVPIIGARDQVLVYAHGRVRVVQMRLTEELQAKMKGEYKAFFYAEWLGSRLGWVIGEPAPWQSW